MQPDNPEGLPVDMATRGKDEEEEEEERDKKKGLHEVGQTTMN